MKLPRGEGRKERKIYLHEKCFHFKDANIFFGADDDGDDDDGGGGNSSRSSSSKTDLSNLSVSNIISSYLLAANSRLEVI